MEERKITSVDFDTGNQYSMNRYVWDPIKAARNLRDHGVSFEQGVKALNDLLCVERIDERENYGEERINLLGMCDGVLLHVTYAERGEERRIISARRAVKHEQDIYYSKDATGWDSS